MWTTSVVEAILTSRLAHLDSSLVLPIHFLDHLLMVVYDPSSRAQPFCFLEVKCPYSARNITPVEGSASPGFCCTVDTTTGQLKLKEKHPYFLQIQGQMAIRGRPWCDFVVFTGKGLSVQHIKYDEKFWNETLLPKLTTFYDNCVAPEIVSPVHLLYRYPH